MNRPTSYQVRLLKTQVFEGKKAKTHYVRWTVDGQRFQKGFSTHEAAESFRADLRTALNKGEAFSTQDGLPMSWTRDDTSISFYEFACNYVSHRWPEVSAKQRQNMAEALMWATIAMLPEQAEQPAPSRVRHALRSSAFNLSARAADSPLVRQTLAWVEQHCRPIDDLTSADCANALAGRLCTTIAGQTRSVWSQKRNLNVVKTALAWAVDQQLLASNPLANVKRRPVKKSIGIDKRRCMNTDQAQRLLNAIGELPRSGPTMKVFFAVMYYSGLRPEEAVDVRRDAMTLPKTDDEWGEFHLTDASPDVGSEWTDTGNTRDTRGLKQREPGESRDVPMPPPLVALVRHHLNTTPPGPDNRLFRAHQGGILPAVTCRRALHTARQNAFSNTEINSIVAARVYDLRHTRLSKWLNAGVPHTRVAEWAGNSIEVLLGIYAKSIAGEDALYKQRIMAAENPEIHSD